MAIEVGELGCLGATPSVYYRLRGSQLPGDLPSLGPSLEK
jgi:hypothetical protein